MERSHPAILNTANIMSLVRQLHLHIFLTSLLMSWYSPPWLSSSNTMNLDLDLSWPFPMSLITIPIITYSTDPLLIRSQIISISMKEQDGFIYPLPMGAFSKILDEGARQQKGSEHSLAQKYRKSVKARKELQQRETKAKGKLNYERSRQLEEHKKEVLAHWRDQYLGRHKRTTLSSDSLFRLTAPNTANPRRRLSMEDYRHDYKLIPEASKEYSKVRADNMKQLHQKHQKMIQKRRLEEFQRNAASAAAIKRDRRQGKENLRNFLQTKKERTAWVINHKIQQEQAQETNIRRRIERVQKARQQLKRTQSRDSNVIRPLSSNILPELPLAAPPVVQRKLLFIKIL